MRRGAARFILFAIGLAHRRCQIFTAFGLAWPPPALGIARRPRARLWHAGTAEEGGAGGARRGAGAGEQEEEEGAPGLTF